MTEKFDDTKWRIPQWFPQLDAEVRERLRIYQIELLRWTRKINLISPNSVAEADKIHFADSILGSQIILRDLGSDSGEIWDIGSGNGFPGIVLALLSPSRGVFCLDADERKVSFIKQVSARLEMKNLAARLDRVENLPAECIYIGVARGFAPLSKALMTTNKQFGSGGRFYHFKGPEWKRETMEVIGTIRSTWNTSFVEQYELPDDSSAKKDIRVILKSTKVQ